MKKLLISGIVGLSCISPVMAEQSPISGIVFSGRCDVLHERNFDDKLNVPCKVTKDLDNLPNDKLYIDGVGYTINEDFEKTIVMGGKYGFKEFKAYHPRYGVTYNMRVENMTTSCIKYCN